MDTAAAGWSVRRFEVRWNRVLYPRHSPNILSHLRTLFQRMMVEGPLKTTRLIGGTWRSRDRYARSSCLGGGIRCSYYYGVR